MASNPVTFQQLHFQMCPLHISRYIISRQKHTETCPNDSIKGNQNFFCLRFSTLTSLTDLSAVAVVEELEVPVGATGCACEKDIKNIF